MTTTEVSELLGRTATHYIPSDLTRNRCKIEMGEFTGLVTVDRNGLYLFHLYFSGATLLRVIASRDLGSLLQQTNDYLTTLSKALERQSNDTDSECESNSSRLGN